MEPLAGISLAQRIEGIPYFLSEAFSVAITTLVAQAYGSKDIVFLKKTIFWTFCCDFLSKFREKSTA